MSPEGRRRVTWSGIRTLAAIAVLGGIAWGGVEITAALQGTPKKFASAAEAVPVKDVVLVTDGVLDQKWLVRTLALPKGATLMGLDLFKLRARVLASGQVHAATLTRTFPATLTVSLAENSPVARVMAQAGADEPRMFLVARDGTVFDGVGFDAEMVGTLPWLDGVKLARKGDAFAPIAGMEAVADLLAKAKLEAEHLYRTWRVVSLARLESDGEIEVRADGVGKILFGTTEDFFRQLARLDSLLDAARAKTDAPIREINLAIGTQVPVAFEAAALAPGAQAMQVAFRAPVTATPAKMPVLPAFPNFQHPSKL